MLNYYSPLRHEFFPDSLGQTKKPDVVAILQATSLVPPLLIKQQIEYFVCPIKKAIMKTILGILGLTLTLSAIGQQHSISINYIPSTTYFGKQSENFRHHYFASRKGDRTFNSAANILYNYRLLSGLSFGAGLEYSQQGQNINFNADSAFPSSNRQILKAELNYLRIPFTIGYSIFKIKTSEFNIYSGVSLGIAIKRKDNYQDIILERILLPPARDRYKSLDWAVPVGINYTKELTSKLFANFSGEYLIGLTNAFSENAASKFGVLSEFDNSRQSRLALNIGIGFNPAK
ncbi:hypothetical protein BH20BAC1_BH20BAC1_23380 [soil metagenome]